MKRPPSTSAPFLKRISLPVGKGSGYPYDLPIFKKGFELQFTSPVTIIAGENGTGKSTLIESIAAHCGFNLSGGSRNHVYSEERAVLSEFARSMRFSWLPKVTQGFFMRAESFYNFASYIDTLAHEFGPIALAPYGGKSLHDQSHGEAFLSLFTNRIGGRGIYLMDEPEAALSPMRQLALLAIIRELENSKQAQIILATHSPMLMAYPGAQFLYVSDDRLQVSNYRDTPHYQTMKRFLERPERFFQELFEAGD
jgi:predicted ATPase